MRKSGTAYVNPENTQNYQSVSAKLTAEEQKVQDMGNRLETSYASIEQKIKRSKFRKIMLQGWEKQQRMQRKQPKHLSGI